MDIKLIWSSILLAFTLTTASQGAIWSQSSVSLLSGSDYIAPFPSDGEDENYDQTILTFEHASGWDYGDNFFFADIERADSRTPAIYFEWAPRFTISKLLNHKPGFLKDYGISLQLNQASGLRRIWLYGFYVDLTLPGFDFFQTNVLVRDDLAIEGQTTQITFVWQAPLIANTLTFGGFLDIASEEGDEEKNSVSHANILAQPQLLYHVTKELAFGLEYQFWQNKLGSKDKTESVPQAMVKWTL